MFPLLFYMHICVYMYACVSFLYSIVIVIVIVMI